MVLIYFYILGSPLMHCVCVCFYFTINIIVAWVSEICDEVYGTTIQGN